MGTLFQRKCWYRRLLIPIVQGPAKPLCQQLHAVFLKKQNDGGTGQVKAALFHAAAYLGVFMVVDNAADDQRADFRLDHRAEMVALQQRPATAI